METARASCLQVPPPGKDLPIGAPFLGLAARPVDNSALGGLRHKQARRQRRGPQLAAKAPSGTGKAPAGATAGPDPDKGAPRSGPADLCGSGGAYADTLEVGVARLQPVAEDGASAPIRRSRRLATAALVGLLSLYQSWSAGRVPRCRFMPSCSAYAIGSVRSYGPCRGLGLAVRRLARCRPGGSFGYDPLPLLAARGVLEEGEPW